MMPCMLCPGSLTIMIIILTPGQKQKNETSPGSERKQIKYVTNENVKHIEIDRHATE